MSDQNKPAGISRKPYKRSVRNILVHKPMQREFTLILVALLMVSSLFVGFVIHDTIREAAFGGGFRFGKISPFEVLNEVRYQLILKVTCILFATLIVTGIFAVFFLHRVAGPVYRFRLAFAKINRGEVPKKVKLREGDFFAETAEEVNKIIERNAQRHESLNELKKRLESIRNSDAPGDAKLAAEEALQIVNSKL